MKQALFVCAVIGVIGLYACKKEEKTVTVTETIHDTITNPIWFNGKVDPDTLSAGIKVGYGTRVAAAFPAATTAAGSPELDTLYNRTYQVIAGQYLFIYPPAIDGYIAGYYVQIAGATSYFKVAYPTPTARTVSGFADATIAIELPKEIKGDTFAVKYAAYDEQGRVSAPVTGLVRILPQGNTAFEAALNGTWTYYGRRYYKSTTFTDEWRIDTILPFTQKYYTCTGTTLTESTTVTDLQLTEEGFRNLITFSFDKYAFTREAVIDRRTLDVANSTCSSFAYNYADAGGGGSETGGYYYDKDARKLTLILNSQTSNIDFDYETYTVLEMGEHRLVLGLGGDDRNEGNEMIMLGFYK